VKEHYIKSFRLFFRFFIITWLFHLVIQIYLTSLEIDLKEDLVIIYYINIVLNIFHIAVFAYILIKKVKPDYPELVLSFDKIFPKTLDVKLLYCFALGITLGYILPILGNTFVYLEGTMMSEISQMALDSYASYFKQWSFFDFFLYLIIGTIVYNFFREFFFRQVLLSLMNRDENITKSTVQVSILFVLSYYIYQINQLDFISLFLVSIILSFIFFKTKSVLSATVAAIGFDLPVYALFFVPDLEENAKTYLTVNDSTIFFVFAAAIIAYYCLYLINEDNDKSLVE
jgi:membrane protease YdiL (CAAX protease family)